MRLFLDANVIFSAAHNPAGNAHALFGLAAGGRISLAASRYAIEEAARNIALKFPDCAAELATLLGRMVIGPEPAPGLVDAATAVDLPDKDAPTAGTWATATDACRCMPCAARMTASTHRHPPRGRLGRKTPCPA